MQKTIEIEGKDIKFKCNASFPIVYKNHFGHDILTILMPLISEALKGMDNISQSEEVTPSLVGEMLENIYSLEMVDVMHLIWTLAYMADDTISDCDKWFASFDEFEIFDVTKELLEIILPSLISKKKLQSLKLLKNTQK